MIEEHQDAESRTENRKSEKTQPTEQNQIDVLHP